MCSDLSNVLVSLFYLVFNAFQLYISEIRFYFKVKIHVLIDYEAPD